MTNSSAARTAEARGSRCDHGRVKAPQGKATFTAWRNPDPETAEGALRAAQGALTNPCADACVCR
jgi:hypothetical protein